MVGGKVGSRTNGVCDKTYALWICSRAMPVLTGGARLEQTGELYTRWRPTHTLSTFNNNINEMLRKKKKKKKITARDMSYVEQLAADVNSDASNYTIGTYKETKKDKSSQSRFAMNDHRNMSTTSTTPRTLLTTLRNCNLHHMSRE